ncbi:MAG TPA: hydrogenase [Vicinamibacteria bacterium]|nr:hydrogenase [Vicinamibacteria bacterium]
MVQDFVILCAAGMLVSVLLMVGQKALVVAIRLYGVQSLLLGVLAGALGLAGHRSHLLVTAVLTLVLKAALIPWFLLRVIDRVGIRREIQPYLNVPASLILCLGLTVVGYRLSVGMAAARQGVPHQVVGVALSMVLVGLFLMATRRKAITQILALLTLENAVFLAAVGATVGMPLVVELGISFDVILAVLVLGTLVNRIVDRFESMDTSRLSSLRG